ncbi:CBS domain-containing protein [Solimonas aquatica]|uniref:CBS domain-containing protein n=1 Tax=Solimonas aquatica TaxID=489703 RepID=A0A1H9JX82_9GAMM|nr:CBS domain-containing protein [Solimonas aquatica]SEQ91353.1 CBS domain-containing protein [Solimonas aquatica]
MGTLETVRVRDYMSARLMTFAPDMEVMNAVHQLVSSGHSGAPVVDKTGKLVGMLSERDCLNIALVAAQDTCVAGPVSQFMSTNIETVSPDLSITQLASLFLNRNFRRYPVVEDGKLIGQISRSDVLRAISHCC